MIKLILKVEDFLAYATLNTIFKNDNLVMKQVKIALKLQGLIHRAFPKTFPNSPYNR
jgi:hypothetical protein